MKPERWERLQEIFQAALARDSGQIHSYVRQACNGDEELRQEVEALLEAHDDRGFLGSWASEVAEQLLEERLALRPGERLGPYEIEAHVATGGMGMVFRARDTRLHRTVAIKILRPVPGLDDLLAHIRREARSIARLQHPNICSLFDIGLDNGRDYIVMEYIEGHTLAERLRSGPIPADESLRYAIEIAAAIEHAHRRDVIHRDLKPANIILTKTGVKLLDFGLASCLKGVRNRLRR